MRHPSQPEKRRPVQLDGVIPRPRLVASPLPEFDPAIVVDLDLRDDLRAGREPLTRILEASEALPAGAVLHLRTTFQPTPLFALLGGMGFAFHTESFADDDWSSWFWRGEIVPAAPKGAAAEPLDTANALDLRHLPAPEPLRVLLDKIAVATAPFEVLLPAYSSLIDGLLADQRWTIAVVGTSPDGVRVRVAPMG